MATIAITILPLVPLAVWYLLVRWSPAKTEGEQLLIVPIPVLARAKMVTLPFILGVSAIAITAIVADARWGSVGLLLVLTVVLLAIPANYTLTTVGIRNGRGPFRRWTEFAGVRRSPSGCVLVGGQRATSYPIFLSGNREDDDFVVTLKNLVLDSYKGKATERDRLRLGNFRL